ncbi:HAMP domain-containing protein, partial [Ferrovibrio sp.]|uniref:HAMP domain-containing protein n=2 Tax=Ferrovibrio sp. TaxID=1917215 RepID=UPI003512B9D9
MSIASNIRIAPRVLAVVALLAIASAAIGYMGVVSLDRYERQTNLMVDVARQTQFGERLNALVYAVVMDSRGVYMSDDAKDAKRFADGINRFTGQIDELMAEWSRLVGPDAVKTEGAQKFIGLVNDFLKFRRETARLGVEVGPQAANEQGNNDANRANRQALNQAIVAINKQNAERLIAVNDALTGYYNTQRPLLITITVVAIAVSVILALYVVIMTVTRPISRITSVMKTLAQGDTGVAVTGSERRDEIGEMAGAVQVFKDSMIAREQAEAEISQQREDSEKRRQEREARE